MRRVRRLGIAIATTLVAAALPAGATHFDVGPTGLLVWYGGRDGEPVTYDIAAPAAHLRPLTARRRPAPGPLLDPERVVFARRPLTWSQWTGVWPATPGAAPTDRDLALLPPRVTPPTGPPRPGR